MLFLRRERIRAPAPPKPMISNHQVSGSGTAASAGTSEKLSGADAKTIFGEAPGALATKTQSSFEVVPENRTGV